MKNSKVEIVVNDSVLASMENGKIKVDIAKLNDHAQDAAVLLEYVTEIWRLSMQNPIIRQQLNYLTNP